MNIHLADISTSGTYHLMTQTVIPRPIAWVLSNNSDGGHNLAPFSYFNAVCSSPPLLMLSMGKKPNGSDKDTVANLQVGVMCVVHIAHVSQADVVTSTAATLDYGESEVDANNIALCTHLDWPLQRISSSPIAYLCRVHSTQEIGDTPQQLIFVEAIELFIDDSMVTTNNDRIEVDASKVNPLARLGANQYASLGEVFSKHRPK